MTTTTARQTSRSARQNVPNRWWVPAASMLVPMAAFAQANACDQLKATLAARIEATGVRGYQLEVVPSATAVPAGAKAIGNCEGGARKVLYRRWGGASAAATADAAAVPAAPPPAVVVPEPRPKPPPVVRASAPAPVASVVGRVPAPAPAVTLEPTKAAPARAAEASVVPKASPVAAQEVPSIPAEPPADQPPLSQRLAGFVSAQWRWLLVLLLLPLALLGWAWRAHHLAYDKSGLPRGPRL
jgi:hypothetical protein